MSTKRHSITEEPGIMGKKYYATCAACEKIVQVYPVRGYELANGDTKTHYRCVNQMRSYQHASRNKPAKKTKITKREALESVPSSIAESIIQWNDRQAGHCALCEEYVRKTRGKDTRELFVVNDSAGNMIAGLYCWDCRNILFQRLTGRLEGQIRHALEKKRMALTPPTGAGR